MSAPWELSQPVRTDAGLCALWQPQHFAAITSYDAWEDEVSDDDALRRHIEAGALVPLNVGGDGAFQVAVRRGGLTDRERRYVLVSSQPYLLVSQGAVALGGLEDVGIGSPVPVPLEAGRYAVTVHLIDWGAEPGSRAADGSPSATALADFVVLIGPDSGGPYRTRPESFDRP